jgi:PKD repeat protein
MTPNLLPNLLYLDSLEPRMLLTVTPHIQLLNNQDTVLPGQAIHVNAIQTGLAIGADLGVGTPLTARYQWDFGDTTAGAQFDQLPGFNAAHVYDVPGDYTITLTVTNEAGEVGVASQLVHVVTPANAPQTIFVDNTLAATQPDPNGGTDVPSIAAALPLLSNNTQLLFRRGETFAAASTIIVSFSNVTIGAYGDPTAAAPVLQLPSTATQYLPIVTTSSSATNTIVRDLTLTAAGNSKIGVGVQPQGTNIVIRNCNFQNLDDAILSNISPVGVMALGNTAGVLKEYFAYIKGTDHVYLGNTIGDSTGQHNFRTYGIRVLCYGNDVTNLPGGSSIDTLRINDGAWIYWANNTLHDGQIIAGPLGPDSAGSLPGAGVSWLVIENNRELQVSGAANYLSNPRIEIDAGVQHVMIRNNYVESSDTTGISIDTKDVLTWKSSQLPASVIPLPPVTVTKTSTDVQVLNNTIVNPDFGDGVHLGTKGCFIEVSGTTSNAIMLKNNLYVAPKLNTTAYTAAAVRVVSRKDLNNFVNGGIANNDWPAPSNLNSYGIQYVSDGTLSNAAAYYTPSRWASSFSSKVITGEKYEALKITDLSSSLAPPGTSNAANPGATPVVGVFTDLFGDVRLGVWTDGAVQLT